MNPKHTDEHSYSVPSNPFPELLTMDPNLQRELSGQIVLIKYGGNAMVDDQIKQNVITDIVELKKLNITPVIVHGGGPAIQKLLGQVGVESEFIGGHRKTDKEAISYVEMALSGSVNGEIVKLINQAGCKAVGLSGKDGGMVTARKRRHEVEINGKTQKVDLGHVGDVASIQTDLVSSLIDDGYVPVIAPIGVGEDLKDYNINADMFAGHMAGALKANHYLALTDVDGLLADLDDPESLIRSMTADEARAQIGQTVDGGMIPKVESCLIALEEGVEKAHIINGTKPHTIFQELLTQERCGTLITNN